MSGKSTAAGLPGPPRGFTLLELLVVLALVGLVAAIAFPNLERLYGAVTRETERDYTLDQFAGLGRWALRQGYLRHHAPRGLELGRQAQEPRVIDRRKRFPSGERR